jgi:glycerol-3-phosphate acyltransferase PlsY
VDTVSYIATAVLAYLLGSIPTGFLVAKGRGIDIRSVGSGNIGATNVVRILGKPAGVLVLLMDALKGWVAVVVGVRIVLAILRPETTAPVREYHALLAAVAAVLGHNYTCWLRFKGGKGIATSAGVLAALVPWALIIIVALWVALFALSGFVSLGSLAASAALPLASWATGESLTMVLVTVGLAALAIYKHRGNIRRLINGTEHRVRLKKEAAS